jgi:UDPglucose--hexose-1-phosphate uridylyltransferase
MAGITKRPARLSGGRELFYFDDADTSLPAGRAADTRPAVPRPALPTLRQDPLTGEWISIAAARQARAALAGLD